MRQNARAAEAIKKNKYTNENFSWWKYDDKDTYFALCTKRKN